MPAAEVSTPDAQRIAPPGSPREQPLRDFDEQPRPMPAPLDLAEALTILVARVRRNATPLRDDPAGSLAPTEAVHALDQIDQLITELRAPAGHSAKLLGRTAELSDALRWLLAAAQLQKQQAARTVTPLQRQYKRCVQCGSALRPRASGELVCPRCGFGQL
jgi:hypothetical protein